MEEARLYVRLRELARGSERDHQRALDRLRSRIQFAVRKLDGGWSVDKIAAYFNVSPIELRRELRKAGRSPGSAKLPATKQGRKIANPKVAVNEKSANAMKRLKKVWIASGKDLDDVCLRIGGWFEGMQMSRHGSVNSKAALTSKYVDAFRALHAGYPVSGVGTVHRCTMISLKDPQETNAKLLQRKRFVPGDKPIQSWTRDPAVAEKFYLNIHSNHGRGKGYSSAWVILSIDGKRYAVATVDSARQFYIDVLACRDQLISAGMANEKDFWMGLHVLKSFLKRLSSSFIQSQQEVVCVTPSGKSTSCDIHSILYRVSAGNQIKKRL